MIANLKYFYMFVISGVSSGSGYVFFLFSWFDFLENKFPCKKIGQDHFRPPPFFGYAHAWGSVWSYFWYLSGFFKKNFTHLIKKCQKTIKKVLTDLSSLHSNWSHLLHNSQKNTSIFYTIRLKLMKNVCIVNQNECQNS